MTIQAEYRELGMDRNIPRRDFLNGLAVGIAGAYAVATAPTMLADCLEAAAPQANGSSTVYPPARMGLRGNYPSAVAAFGPIQSGAYRQFPALDVDTHESYDLVVVGGGISGLAAAHFWRRALGNGQKILILDNHDDFGGHAKRNEFNYEGRTFIGYGGTMGIATPYPYSYTAKRLVEELGIEVGRNSEFQKREAFRKLNLGPAMFFDKEHFGEDRVVVGNGRIPWPEFLGRRRRCLPPSAQVSGLHGQNTDYMAGMSHEEKIAALAKISWQDFLLKYPKIQPTPSCSFRGQGGRNNKGSTDAALEAARRGFVGFNGLGMEREEAFRKSRHTRSIFLMATRPSQGFSSTALSPQRFRAASWTMNTVVQAALELRGTRRGVIARADQAEQPRGARAARRGPRAREHCARGVPARREGPRRCAAHVILACNNSFIPSLMPELPDKQKQALAYSVKVPMMYNNVLIRRWTAFAKLGAANISSPCMLHTGTSLNPGSTVGGYRGVTTPDEPIIVHMTSNPNKPGLPRKEQNRAGAQQLLTTTFEQFELGSATIWRGCSDRPDSTLCRTSSG